MFASDRIIALDIGASKLVVAEFKISRGGNSELTNYGVGQLGTQVGDSDTSAYIVSTIRQVMRERGIRPAPLYMTVSGQSAFPRFVKLPPVAKDKVLQIIRYEAEQNVPFPIEEVVWDYQLLGGDPEASDEVNVMLIAVKTENVKRLTDCVDAAGLEPEVVDVAPMAIYNAVRYNYPDLQGCTLVLDIGARSSNLVFLEEDRVFTRSIPVAGNSITQEVMKEFGIEFEEAEALKREHAFVAFGGVYAGADNETADRISKVVRNVITRLHAEVNRSINFYRSQQGGSPPSRVLLLGGSSIIPHTDTFFREKLKVDVEYMNPFAALAVSPAIETSRIEKDVHLLGEVAGLGIRAALTCPIEINLMPPDLVARKVFRKRQPFFALAAIGLVLTMLCWWVYFNKMHSVWEDRIRQLELQIGARRQIDAELRRAVSEREGVAATHAALVNVVEGRGRWLQWIESIHGCMLDGMWLRSLAPVKANGRLMLEISGKGFEDRLKTYDSAQATAIEVFRDRLRASPLFTDKTMITAQPPPPPGAYAREFTIRIGLAENEPEAERTDA